MGDYRLIVGGDAHGHLLWRYLPQPNRCVCCVPPIHMRSRLQAALEFAWQHARVIIFTIISPLRGFLSCGGAQASVSIVWVIRRAGAGLSSRSLKGKFMPYSTNHSALPLCILSIMSSSFAE